MGIEEKCLPGGGGKVYEGIKVENLAALDIREAVWIGGDYRVGEGHGLST